MPKFISFRNQIKNKEQRDQIFDAIRKGDLNTAKDLMNGNPETYADALYKAMDSDQLKVAEVLMKRFNANPNISHSNIVTHAAADGRLDKLKLLHKYGGNINKQPTLNWAVQMGHENVIDWLKDNNVKTDGETFNMIHRYLIEPQGKKASDEDKARIISKVLSMNPRPDQFVYPSMLSAVKNDPMANKVLRQYGNKYNLSDETKFDKGQVVNRHGDNQNS